MVSHSFSRHLIYLRKLSKFGMQFFKKRVIILLRTFYEVKVEYTLKNRIPIMSLIPSSTSLMYFKLLSFDVYGTLINWETGSYEALQSSPPIARLSSNHPLKDRTFLLQTYELLERSVQAANPKIEYADLLTEVYKGILGVQNVEVSDTELEEEALKFADSFGKWPAFPDTSKH